MAYGDVRHKWVMAGSTATSAATAHNLLGSYAGLSLLTNDDVVHIQVQSIANDMLIGPIGNVSNDIGYRITTTLSWIDLPPMRAGTASQLQMCRAGGTNATAMWVIWSRVP